MTATATGGRTPPDPEPHPAPESPFSGVRAPGAAAPPRAEPDRSPATTEQLPDLLSGLNPEQRRAASITAGPVAILAGAGTGKTRVISHRVAHAISTAAVLPQHVLLVTFTDKAAKQMKQRVRDLGVSGVEARTFHAAALRQVRHFWPLVHGRPAPELAANQFPLLAPLVRRLPGGYRFTQLKDVTDALSWARNQQLPTDRLESAAAAQDRTLPLPADLLRRVSNDYAGLKKHRNLMDFDDVIEHTTNLLADDRVAERVHDRYRWFSVDEFQDTNPAQHALLLAWLGDRQDLCVVGDPNQTIFSFTGATSSFLTDFAREHAGAAVISLTQNYRSTPQVLALANRIVASNGRPAGGRSAPAQSSQQGPGVQLQPTRPDGSEPLVTERDDDAAEVAGVVRQVREGHEQGVPYERMAVLSRLNADLEPYEAALGAAGIPCTVRGSRFHDRPEVRHAGRLVLGLDDALRGTALADAAGALLERELGFEPDANSLSGQARERNATLRAWLDLVTELADDPDTGPSDVAVALQQRAEQSRRSSSGVELATIHRAKGLEWEWVFLPGLVEGRLPVPQAKSPASVAEERRLFYVAVTRARDQLLISWAATTGTGTARTRSRFLRELDPPGTPARSSSHRSSSGRQRSKGGRREAGRGVLRGSGPDSPTLRALRTWRSERAKSDEVPAYVIFHDATLESIAESSARLPDDLLSIKGVGPTKVGRYGTDVIAILRANQ